MARALRDFYPLVRFADERLEDARRCEAVAAGAAERKACGDAYYTAVANIRKTMPSDSSLAGCAQLVSHGVRDQLDRALGEKRAPMGKLVGVSWSDLHESYGACAAQLYRVGAMNEPTDPAKPSEVETHIGLRSGERFSVAQFDEDRTGHLWTASGREIDRKTLELKP